MAGYEMRGDKTTEIHAKGFGFDPRTLTTKPVVFPDASYANSALFKQYTKSEYENRYISYYMTGSYMYDNRYTFFGSLRYDGSNLFGVAKKYKYLPLWSVSGAWNINREEFMSQVDWLTNLKLRVSYGVQGNVDKNTSPFIMGAWGNVSILPDTNEPNIEVSSPPNQNLRWEKTKNWNFGWDMGVFKNRLTFSVDAYKRISNDLIGTRALPGESGFDFTNMNWAKVTNKGFEFALSSVNVKTNNFRWTMDFNIARNKSIVNQINVKNSSWQPSGEGYPVGALFALKTAGLDENGNQMFYKNGEKVSFYDFFGIEYTDFWGSLVASSKLNVEDYRKLFTYVGTSEPKFSGGFINRFYYKGFDLTVSTSFILDQTVKETPFYDPVSMSPGRNYSRRVFDIWSPVNPEGKYPGLLGSATEGEYNGIYQYMTVDDRGITAFQNFDYWFKKMSYWRINSIRLGYNLPDYLLKKMHMAGVRVSAEVRNPWVVATNYKGYFDPESYGNIYAQPLPKTFSVGLDLTF